MTEQTNSETGREGEFFPLSTTANDVEALDSEYTREEVEAARSSAEEIAYLHVGRAWMDRWEALGGNVGLTYDQDDLKPIGVHRGMVCDLDYWTPTDEGREDIPPHTWIYREDHHDGAVKALEGLLELVPGLKEAVREIAGKDAFGRRAHGRTVPEMAQGIQMGKLYVRENQSPPSSMAWEEWLKHEWADRDRRYGPVSRLRVRREVVQAIAHPRHGGPCVRLDNGHVDGPYHEWAFGLDLIGKVAGIYRPSGA